MKLNPPWRNPTASRRKSRALGASGLLRTSRKPREVRHPFIFSANTSRRSSAYSPEKSATRQLVELLRLGRITQPLLATDVYLISKDASGLLDPFRENVFIRAARISQGFGNLKFTKRPRELTAVVQDLSGVKVSQCIQRAL